MSKQRDDSTSISRRSVITHIGAGILGWLIGSFLDPLRRGINEIILETPLGRKAQINFAYRSTPDIDGIDYRVYISNSGSETAEDLSIHLAFEEQITTARVEDKINTPPSTDTDIQITDRGIARLTIESVRRNVQEHWNPILIDFSVEEGTTSSLSYEINDGEAIFTAYRYSWTYLGERYYESTNHHISQKE